MQGTEWWFIYCATICAKYFFKSLYIFAYEKIIAQGGECTLSHVQYFRTYKLAVHFVSWKSNFHLVVTHFRNSYNSNLYYT